VETRSFSFQELCGVLASEERHGASHFSSYMLFWLLKSVFLGGKYP